MFLSCDATADGRYTGVVVKRQDKAEL